MLQHFQFFQGEVSGRLAHARLANDFNAGKKLLVLFDRSNNTGAIEMKMDRSVLEKNNLFKCSVCRPRLNWIGVLPLSPLLKLPSIKLEAWFVMNFLSPEAALYLCKSTVRPCMEYCCHVWPGTPSYYLNVR